MHLLTRCLHLYLDIVQNRFENYFGGPYLELGHLLYHKLFGEVLPVDEEMFLSAMTLLGRLSLRDGGGEVHETEAFYFTLFSGGSDSISREGEGGREGGGREGRREGGKDGRREGEREGGGEGGGRGEGGREGGRGEREGGREGGRASMCVSLFASAGAAPPRECHLCSGGGFGAAGECSTAQGPLLAAGHCRLSSELYIPHMIRLGFGCVDTCVRACICCLVVAEPLFFSRWFMPMGTRSFFTRCSLPSGLPATTPG